MKQLLCIGTYTEPILFGTGEIFQGKGKGVSLCEFEEGVIRERTALPVRNPSFLCVDEKRRKIYAVNEMKKYRDAFGGGITQIDFDSRGIMQIRRDDNTGGTDPCHVVLSPDGRLLCVANFASGALTVFPLDEEGNLTGERRLFQHAGSSVHPVRQRGPHAHSTIFAPEQGRFYVPDLGIDRVVAYRWQDGAVLPEPEADIAVPAGSGPRFGEFSRDGRHFYLLCEVASSVMHFRCEDGHMVPGESINMLPENFSGDNIGSDLHLTPDGKYLYASNRGHDSLVFCRVEADGSLTLLRRQPCGGRTPRNFVIDPAGRYLLVGNQDSDNITTFSIGEEGELTQVSQCDWGSPVCLRFFSGAAL